MKAKRYILICWVCRQILTVPSKKQAEEQADLHGLTRHRRSGWDSFMEVQTIESLDKERAIEDEGGVWS